MYKIICCYPSSEQSWDSSDEGSQCQDSSDEGSQHMVLMRNKKIYHQILPYLELWWISVLKIVIYDGNCQFYCHKLHFTALLLCCQMKCVIIRALNKREH